MVGSLSPSYGPKPVSNQWTSAPILDEQENATVLAVGMEEALVSPSDEVATTLGMQPAKKTLRSRPSLSERTIETLSRLPSSPAVKGKGAASFYDTGSGRRRANSRPDSQSSRP